jgi:hypothetical protein
MKTSFGSNIFIRRFRVNCTYEEKTSTLRIKKKNEGELEVDFAVIYSTQHSLFLPYFINLINHFWKTCRKLRVLKESVSTFASSRRHIFTHK